MLGRYTTGPVIVRCRRPVFDLPSTCLRPDLQSDTVAQRVAGAGWPQGVRGAGHDSGVRTRPRPTGRPELPDRCVAGAGVPGLEPRLTEPESVGLPITPYPKGTGSHHPSAGVYRATRPPQSSPDQHPPTWRRASPGRAGVSTRLRRRPVVGTGPSLSRSRPVRPAAASGSSRGRATPWIRTAAARSVVR